MRRAKFLLLLIALLTVSAPSLVHAMDPTAREKIFTALNLQTPHVKNEVLVQFSTSSTTQDKTRVLNRIRGQKLETLVGPSSQRPTQSVQADLDRVRLPVGLSVADAIRSIETDSSVVFAEPNWIYQHHATSNDTYVTGGKLWGMSSNSTGGSKAESAWSAGSTDCSSVFVGIIDEGYMYTHEDLADNVGVNPGEIPGNKIDDDGNGYVDDVYGWDFDGNNNTVFDGASDDHGTHVAGTIGGVGGNGKGVAGICWSVKLLNAKFLGRNGGTTSNAIKAVDYFTDLKTRHNLNLVATNNSWGGGGFTQALQDAIGRANLKDILFVAAAGNSSANCETSSCYPAKYPNANIISVASITDTGALSSFSNYGLTTVDLGAPGSNIWSSVPSCSGKTCISSYAIYSGTSMATPHVTGAAALYKARNTSATASAIKNALLSTLLSQNNNLLGITVSGRQLNVGGF